MVTIRLFEERVNELYTGAKMPGLAHLYIGEEAVAVGVCEALRKTTTSRARTAATATAWPRARRPTGCSPSCSAKRPATAAARAARCTSPTRHRQSRRQRHRRRQRRHRNRRRHVAQDARERSSRGLLFRRGRARAGTALRGHEHGVALEAAGRFTSARTTCTTSTRTTARPRPAS